MGPYAKAIVSGAGYIAGMASCVAADAPAWLTGIIGIATVLTTIGVRNKGYMRVDERLRQFPPSRPQYPPERQPGDF